MEELLEALRLLNADLADEKVDLRLNVVGGFALYLLDLGIDVRHTHDIDSVVKLTKEIKSKINRIGEELNIDLRWLNDDVLSLYDEFETAGIDLEQMEFSPNKLIDYSNIHLNVIGLKDFIRLKLFSVFLEAYDFMQYNKPFEREQDLKDIASVLSVSDIDYMAILDDVTDYVQDRRYRNLAHALIDAYLRSSLNTAGINEFLKAQRETDCFK